MDFSVFSDASFWATFCSIIWFYFIVGEVLANIHPEVQWLGCGSTTV